jgi:hypothetical protein
MRLRAGCIATLLSLAGIANAGDAPVPIPQIIIEGEDTGPILPVQPPPGGKPGPVEVPVVDAPPPVGPPGRAQPAASQPARAWVIRWDDYRTVLLAGDGAGRTGPGWVLTFHVDATRGLAVAYRASVYRDANGVVHFDARNALITGPMRSQWSADSFAVIADRRIEAIDDAERSNAGAVERVVLPLAGEYRSLLAQALALIQNGL